MSKLEVISFNKQIFHAVSLSGGKDSTAMLLLMIERGLPINTVLWADTGMEFPEMYDHIRKVDDYLYRERGNQGLFANWNLLGMRTVSFCLAKNPIGALSNG